MQLKDYLLTYEVNNEIVVNLFDYYDIYIKHLDERFEKYSYKSSDLVLCYFRDHEDVNPSMGWMNDKAHKGNKVCHCFGCGRTADVVRLHQLLKHQYEGVDFTENESCKDLAQMFGVSLDDFDETTEEDFELRHVKTLRKIDVLKNRYSNRDFSNDLLDARRNAVNGVVDLNKVNSACVKLIATSKELYI